MSLTVLCITTYEAIGSTMMESPFKLESSHDLHQFEKRFCNDEQDDNEIQFEASIK